MTVKRFIWAKTFRTFIIVPLFLQVSFQAQGAAPDFIPESPESKLTSEYVQLTEDGGRYGVAPDLGFCSEWNPEFSYNGYHCCKKFARTRKARAKSCFRQRAKASFCDERTAEQQRYVESVSSGKVSDVLSFLDNEIRRSSEQAFCTVNNGFLAQGRPILATASNRLLIRNAGRCVAFGTDRMAALTEWLGRQVVQKYAEAEYSNVKLLVGDVSAPRGGCLLGLSGRKGHASHTSGQDVDLGFLWARKNAQTPNEFYRTFDPKTNFWLVQNILQNPYACVRVIFLDRKHIRSLNKEINKHGSQEDRQFWAKMARFVRHAPGHANHFHVRVGSVSGAPGCTVDARPELEPEDENALPESNSEVLEVRIPSRSTAGSVAEFQTSDVVKVHP